ncbi:hypothetical protein SAMN05421837_103819 [Amycolatopsis pretoriensis]|uniref:Uncharacterized protein n=1 Tax=Amycolatopsis pretoriensis TaxID=218821 RepID=A0A1H5QMN5_9PSEU|nr:hypothetical protein [Amycolatopsis pretoriensis]SEF27412.1 hypothetical protein SAMN05421837_103819 [Amycolatopsis pretoriensis]
MWKILSAKTRSDVYLVSLPTAHTMKVSFHESGQWQHSFLSNVAMQYVDTNAERHVDRWEQPRPFISGLRRGYRVSVPHTELRLKADDGNGQVRWIPDPGVGFWVNIHVVFQAPELAAAVAWKDSLLVGELRLHDGGKAIVVAQRVTPDPAHAVLLAQYRDMVLHNLRGQGFADTLADPVALMYGCDDDGTRTVTELALTPPPVGHTPICSARYRRLDGIGIQFRQPRAPSSG